MKKIIFTFLSCVILAALLSVESFAAAVVPMDSPESTAYKQLSTEKREYYSKLLKSGKKSAMGTLLKENSDRRKAFNKHEDTSQNTQKIDAILKDRKRVSTRPASDTEKDDILKLLMATVITDPDTLSAKMTTNLDVAKSSSDPLDRHSYIVDMAGSFAYELITTGKIESDFSTFEAFSGVDKNRFLKLFYQVKGNHRRGLKIKNIPAEEPEESEEQEESIAQILFMSGETIQDLLNVAHQNTHPFHGKILHSLHYTAVAALEKEVRQKALDTLIAIANDKYNPLKAEALLTLFLIVINEKDTIKHANQMAGGEASNNKAKQTLIEIAKNDDHPEQVNALRYVILIRKNQATFNEALSKEALSKLITIANTNGHSQQQSALWMLSDIPENVANKDIRNTAWKALIATANTDGHSLRIDALVNILKYINISKYKGARQKALGDLITIANINAHSLQNEALEGLGDLIRTGWDEEIRSKARQALIDISKDETKSEEVRDAARLALESPAAADDGTNGPVRMTFPITQAG